MQQNERAPRSSTTDSRSRQIYLLAQLMQEADYLRSIDEIFSRVAGMIVQHFDIQAIQFWTLQASSTEQLSVLLRAYAGQDPSLPPHVINNPHIAEVAGQLIHQQQSIQLQPASVFFSHYHANLLKRYGLNYWFGHFLHNDTLLPPPEDYPLATMVATPFSMVALLFVRRIPSQELVSTISYHLEQVVSLAQRKGFLLAATTNQSHLRYASETPVPESTPSLSELIPYRPRNEEEMRSRSPFAHNVPPMAKHVLRLYQAIDGQHTLAQLSLLTQLSPQEMAAALRTLLEERRIQLRNEQGQVIDSAWLLRHL